MPLCLSPIPPLLMTQITSKSYNSLSSSRRQQRIPFVRYFLLSVIAIQGYRVIVKFLPSDPTHDEIHLHNQKLKSMIDENGQIVRVSREKYIKKDGLTSNKNNAAAAASTPTTRDPPAKDDVLTKHGTGPAKHGYVVDLVEERKHKAFRDTGTLPDSAYFAERTSMIAQTLGDTWEACEIIQEGDIQHDTKCLDGSVELGVYNGAPFSRYLCGNELLPGQSMLLKECDTEKEPIRLSPSTPTVDGSHRNDNPIRFLPFAKKESDKSSLSFQSIKGCDIPCEFESSIADLTSPGIMELSVDEWKVRFTYDDPYFNGNAKIERTDFQRDIFYATTSFQSSVPLSFYNFDRYSLRKTKALPWKDLQNKVTYLVNSDCNAGRRNKWAAAVKAAMAFDSYGSCEKTATLAPGESLDTMEGRLELLRKNRIALILEKGTDKDHITEQVWEALMAGVVPAVNGAGNVEVRVPKGSIITSAAFNSWDNFAQYLKKVSEDQVLWESFHQWRTNTTEIERFEDEYLFVKTPPQCRLCRWAYAKQYGLGWDHKHQVVTKTHIDQTLCIDDSTKLIAKPFVEKWDASTLTTGKAESCAESTSITTTFDDGIVRKAISHDGVVDIELTNTKESTLSLTFELRNTGGAYFPDVHILTKNAKRSAAISSASFQDPMSRITVLADWETRISSSEQGIITIKVGTSSKPQRIRVITEDMDDLHGKLTEFYPSTFGQKMMLDFIDPIEYFYKS